VEPSLDAAVTNTSSKNLVFRNDTENSIFIYTEVTKETATVYIYGTPPEHRLVLESVIVKEEPTTRKRYVKDTSGKHVYYTTDAPVLKEEGRGAVQSQGWLVAYDWETGEEVSREQESFDSYTAGTNVYWKGFSLYALFNFRMGAWVYNTTRASKVEGADPHYNADQRVFDDRWKQPGDHAVYKDIADSSRPQQTDRFAEKENTLSLGSLNLSYEFSDGLCKRMSLRNLRLGVNFTDLLRLSTVKIERGTDYLYSQGFEFYLNVTL
jgi:hypothetical protein